MAIKISGVGVRLTSVANTTVYTVPLGVQSATIATGTANNTTLAEARLFMRIGGARTLWIINNKDILGIGSPLVLPPITLNPGERLECWCSVPDAIDLALTIGVQQ